MPFEKIASSEVDSCAEAVESLPEPEFVYMAIQSLKPHPKQLELFPETSISEIDGLKDELRKNPDVFAIEICSDNTVIAGQRWLDAAKSSGMDKILCFIRYDLEAEGPESIELRLIEDNLTRPHLHELTQARAYCERLNTKRKREGYRLLSDKELRAMLAKIFGEEPKWASRMLKKLKMPIEIQRAHEAELLSGAKVERFAGLEQGDQCEIIQQIQSGVDPNEALDKYLGSDSAKITIELRSKMKKFIEEYSSNPAGILKNLRPSDLDWLEPALPIFTELISAIQNRKKPSRPWTETVEIMQRLRADNYELDPQQGAV